MTERRLISAIEPSLVTEGAGVLLRRSFSPRISNLYDPFLLFDHFAFNDPQEDPHPGFPTHPHRGIETVTYILSGSVRHRDSIGNVGTIGPGDVQWMTAGGGIMHEEMPRLDDKSFNKGFQLWVNLPASRKMTSPQYQEIKAKAIHEIENKGIKVRLITGEFEGKIGPVSEIATEPIYMEVSLSPHSVFNLPTPSWHTCLAYLFEGGVTILSDLVTSINMLVFSEGEKVEIRAGAGGERRRETFQKDRPAG